MGGELRLGKLPAVIDSRTMKLSAVLRELPPLPAEFDLDKQLNLNECRMFANDQYGDCVIAGRAHMTMRFEKFEQQKALDIADQEVVNQYFKESGGKDSGLVMLTSLNSWRHDGWKVAGQTYGIHAFTSINKKSHSEVMATIYLLNGVYCGFLLPLSAQTQFAQGLPWSVKYDGGADAVAGSWGGHCVYGMAYEETGPVCITWGKRQQMTWAFWDAYCEESYAVVDNPDKWVENSPVDSEKIESILAEITSSPIPSPTPTPSPCKIGNAIAAMLNHIWPIPAGRKGRFMYMNPKGS